MSSRVGRRTNAASAVLGSRLTKAQRQMIALTFDESARRHAKSVQVKMSPRGHVTASVYLEWPARQDTAEDKEPTRGDPSRASMGSSPDEAAPARPAPAETDVPQPTGNSDSGVPKYTVHEPAKSSPSRGKATMKPNKVDKNALSAKGGVQKDKPPPKPQSKPPPSPLRMPTDVPPSSIRVGACTLVKREKRHGREWRRSGERSGSDSPPYKSPRGSDYESSAGSDLEVGDDWDGYG